MRLVVLAALLIGAALACAGAASAADSAAYPHPSRTCDGLEDYPNGRNPPRIASPEESRYRFLHRPWHNTGLGHAMEVYNLVFKLALHNNLTFVHSPLELGHGPFIVPPEDYFQFGRHPTEADPAMRTATFPAADGADDSDDERSARQQKKARRQRRERELTVLSFPPKEMGYKSHRNEAEPKFAAFARAHSDSHMWFDIPTAMVLADQDSDWSETGAWYRHKYEAARDDRAYGAARGLDAAVRVTAFERAAVNVAVHVRRGDALMMGGGPAHDAYYIATINAVVLAITEQLRADGFAATPIHVHIFSDANKDLNAAGGVGVGRGAAKPALKYIDEKGRDSDIVSQLRGVCSGCVRLHLGGDAMQTFHHFVYSDVMIQSMSMFSNTAAVVSRNVKVFSHWNRSLRSLPNTVAADAVAGGFQDAAARQRFDTLWRAYAKCNGQRWRTAENAGSTVPLTASALPAAAAPAPPPPPAAAPSSGGKRQLTAEEEEELHRRAHDDL